VSSSLTAIGVVVNKVIVGLINRERGCFLLDSGAGVEGGPTSAAGGGDFAAAILGFFFPGWPGSGVWLECEPSYCDRQIWLPVVVILLRGHRGRWLTGDQHQARQEKLLMVIIIIMVVFSIRNINVFFNFHIITFFFRYKFFLKLLLLRQQSLFTVDLPRFLFLLY
jgi:hypothetical protein